MSPALVPPPGEPDDERRRANPAGPRKKGLPRPRRLRLAIEKAQNDHELEVNPEARDEVALFREEVQAEWRASGRSYTLLELETEAQTRWARSKRPGHKHLERYLIETIPSTIAVPRLSIVPLAEVRAMRFQPEAGEVAQGLVTGHAFGRNFSLRRGRGPADGRTALALIEHQAYLAGKVAMLSTWNELDRSNKMLHWALDFPLDSRTVTTYSGGLEGVHSLFRFTDQEIYVVAKRCGGSPASRTGRRPRLREVLRDRRRFRPSTP